MKLKLNSKNPALITLGFTLIELVKFSSFAIRIVYLITTSNFKRILKNLNEGCNLKIVNMSLSLFNYGLLNKEYEQM